MNLKENIMYLDNRKLEIVGIECNDGGDKCVVMTWTGHEYYSCDICKFEETRNVKDNSWRFGSSSIENIIKTVIGNSELPNDKSERDEYLRDISVKPPMERPERSWHFIQVGHKEGDAVVICHPCAHLINDNKDNNTFSKAIKLLNHNHRG